MDLNAVASGRVAFSADGDAIIEATRQASLVLQELGEVRDELVTIATELGEPESKVQVWMRSMAESSRLHIEDHSAAVVEAMLAKALPAGAAVSDDLRAKLGPLHASGALLAVRNGVYDALSSGSLTDRIEAATARAREVVTKQRQLEEKLDKEMEEDLKARRKQRHEELEAHRRKLEKDLETHSRKLNEDLEEAAAARRKELQEEEQQRLEKRLDANQTILKAMDDALYVSVSWGEDGRPRGLEVPGNVPLESRVGWLLDDVPSQEKQHHEKDGPRNPRDERIARMMAAIEALRPTASFAPWDHFGSGLAEASSDDDQLRGDKGPLLLQQLYLGRHGLQRRNVVEDVVWKVEDVTTTGIIEYTIHGNLLSGMKGMGKSTLLASTAAGMASCIGRDARADAIVVYVAEPPPSPPLPSFDPEGWKPLLGNGSVFRLVDRALQLAGLRDDMTAAGDDAMADLFEPLSARWNPSFQDVNTYLAEAAVRLSEARGTPRRPLKVVLILDEFDLWFRSPVNAYGLQDFLRLAVDRGPYRFWITGSAAYLKPLAYRHRYDVEGILEAALGTNSAIKAAIEESMGIVARIDDDRVRPMTPLAPFQTEDVRDFLTHYCEAAGKVMPKETEAMLPAVSTARDALHALSRPIDAREKMLKRFEDMRQEVQRSGDERLAAVLRGCAVCWRLTGSFQYLDTVAKADPLAYAEDLQNLVDKPTAIRWAETGLVDVDTSMLHVQLRALGQVGAMVGMSLCIPDGVQQLSFPDLLALWDPSGQHRGKVVERIVAEGVCQRGVGEVLRKAVEHASAKEGGSSLEAARRFLPQGKVTLEAQRGSEEAAAGWDGVVLEDFKLWEQSGRLSDSAKLEALLGRMCREANDVNGGDFIGAFKAPVAGERGMWQHVMRGQVKAAVAPHHGAGGRRLEPLRDAVTALWRGVASSVDEDGVAGWAASQAGDDVEGVVVWTVLASQRPVRGALPGGSGPAELQALAERHGGVHETVIAGKRVVSVAVVADDAAFVEMLPEGVARFFDQTGAKLTNLR